MPRLLLALLLMLPVSAAAQPAQPATAQPTGTRTMTVAGSFLEGSWALRLDGAIVMRFDLKRNGDGWDGAWIRPTSFKSDRGGRRFGEIVMPAIERRADSGKAIGDWAEITFNDPRPGQEPDVFRLHLLSADKAELLYVGTGMAPFTLERVSTGAPLGPFEDGLVYDDQPGLARVAAPPVVPPSRTTQQAQTSPLVTPPEQSPRSPTSPVQGPVDNRRPAMVGR